MAANTFTQSIQKVSYPVLSDIQDDEKCLKKGYRKIIGNSVYITFPILLGLAAVAPSLFIVLLGDNWAPAIPFFQILCLTGMLYPLRSVNLNILQVRGRTDLFLKIEIIKKVLGLLTIGIVLFLEFGIIGLLWVGVLNTYIGYFISAGYSKALANYSIPEQIHDIKWIYIISFIMGAIIYGVGFYLPLHPIFLLIIQVPLGVGLYILLSLIFKIQEFHTIHGIIMPIIKSLWKKIKRS